MKPLRILGVTLLLLMLLAPVGSIVFEATVGSSAQDLWPALVRYTPNTLLLYLLVAASAWVMGVIPAYLLSVFEFPGSRWLAPFLVLPFAMPVYLLAYIYGDLFEYAGIVQTLYRDLFGYRSAQEYTFFDIRSMGGLAVLMGAGLAPYIYIFTTAALRHQSRNMYETARVLGASHFSAFWRVIVPISRPAWAAGLALVGMETVAEFGAVEHFGVETLTLGIYVYWLQLWDWVIAARLALVGGVVIVVLSVLENFARRQRGYFQAVTVKPLRGLRTTPFVGWLMCAVCLIPLIIGFIIPMLFLLSHTVQHYGQILSGDFYQSLGHTLLLAVLSTVTGGLLACMLALGIPATISFRPVLNILYVGYMLPGTIFALGIMLWLAHLSTLLNSYLGMMILLVGTSFGLIYGYLGRFLCIAHGMVRGGIEAAPKSLDDAARLFGLNSWQVLWRIRLPMIWPHLIAALLIVFVECIKELPMTLIMRPVGVETLATSLYQYAGDENLPEAAPGALFIALCGILPLWLLHRLSSRHNRTDEN